MNVATSRPIDVKNREPAGRMQYLAYDALTSRMQIDSLLHSVKFCAEWR